MKTVQNLLIYGRELLAAAMDPSRKAVVRRALIDCVKKMEPIDAVVFKVCVTGIRPHDNRPLTSFIVERHLPYGQDDLSVSIDALKELKLIAESLAGSGLVTSLGKMLGRAALD